MARKSNFRVGDSLIANIDDKTHQMTITRNGAVVNTFPVSMGMPDGKHETKNSTYYVLEKFPNIIMDSSTYGVPGRLRPTATSSRWSGRCRIDNDGAFVLLPRGRWPTRASATSATAASTYEPGQRQVVLRQLRQRRPHRHQELRQLYNNPDGADDWQWTLY